MQQNYKSAKNTTSIFLYVMLLVTVLLIFSVFIYFSNSSPNIHASKGNNSLITLNGPWKFKTGNNPRWASPQFNDSSWETVDLTAPPGAHDGDVGYSGYVPGWTKKGYPNYSGYAWYRLNVSLDSTGGKEIAFLTPNAVDDAYQLFINGSLIESAGDFSGTIPAIYSIQPRMYVLPDSLRNEKSIIIAFKVWMSEATLSQIPGSGGIHIAPVLGEKNIVELKYRAQWNEIIKGYIVEVTEPVMFFLLAISMFIFYRSNKPSKSCKWFILALLCLALVRFNQAFFSWWQIESIHAYAIIRPVILTPLTLGCWLMAWREWFKIDRPKWLPGVIITTTVIYMAAELLGLPWVSISINHNTYQSGAGYLRLILLVLLAFVTIKGIIKKGSNAILPTISIILLSIGLFAKEFSSLHIIPGIWFPYGVGVSTTQYAYAAFVILMYVILIKRNKQYIRR